MGTFAVLKTSEAFEIDECHINLWCLPGLLGYRVFMCDLGLRVKGAVRPLQSFGLLLPFGTDAKSLVDLSDRITSRQTARLIFGKPVDIQQDKMAIDGQEVRLCRINSVASMLAADSDRGYSHWEMKLARELSPGEDGYVRIRFHVRDRGRMWEWKRPLLVRNGALVDLRICDFRELVVTNWLNHEEDIVEIVRLNLFVVMPAAYQLQAYSPEPRYVRLLEGHMWEQYIGRSVGMVRQRKLVIYSWRNPDENPVSPRARFRVFLDVSREPGLDWLPNLAAASAITVLLFFLVFELPTRFSGALLSTLKWAIGFISIGVVVALFRFVPFLRRLSALVWRGFLQLDGFLHRPSSS